MFVQVPKVLTAGQVSEFRARLSVAPWADGRITAGHQSVLAKHNLQLPENDPQARELGAQVMTALDHNQLFFAAALPRRVFPPLFNCYRTGSGFDNHVDNAVRYERSGDSGQTTLRPMRTDLSCTLFLSEPADYDGGELCIESVSGTQRVKLPAGDLVLYPATSVHRVAPIKRGERLAAFFWVQSMVRDAGQRQLLLELDLAIQRLNRDSVTSSALVDLVGVYHNLLRRWADV